MKIFGRGFRVCARCRPHQRAVVPFTDFKIVKIMCWSNFNCATSHFGIRIFIKYKWNRS